MLHHVNIATKRAPVNKPRRFHTSEARRVFKSLQLRPSVNKQRVPDPSQATVAASKSHNGRVEVPEGTRGGNQTQAAPKRNEAGVQLLARELHSQIFKNISFPPLSKEYVQIARDHLSSHGLDPAQSSVLPDTGFTLPPLRGRTIDEHFHRIGHESGQPYLRLAQEFAAISNYMDVNRAESSNTTRRTPTKPDHWHIQPGWTKYYHHPGGKSYSESVPHPEGEVLAFDVETLPAQHPFAIMACAMSATHWYSWISPWLLGLSSDPQQLVSLGPPHSSRLIVGHNVSYDRARIKEEYLLEGTRTRFLDTMSLHVAVKGISSHQRPAWMKYRKSKNEEKLRKEEAIEVALDLISNEEQNIDIQSSLRKDFHGADLTQIREDIQESLPQLQADDDANGDDERSATRWEEITSANSLVDVAKLYCGIDLDKGIRADFMKLGKDEIIADINDYLDYCSDDVLVTHAVFARTLPEFLDRCPSPVSFSGILTMGSGFLTVNDSWEQYIQSAEQKYQEMDAKIKERLLALAEEAKSMMNTGKWKDDPWLSQLDWTEKEVKASRGVSTPKKQKPVKSSRKTSGWFIEFRKLGPLNKKVKERILPCLFRLSFNGFPVQYSSADGWSYVDTDGTARPIREKSKTWSLFGKGFGYGAFKSGKLSCADDQLVDLLTRLLKGEEGEDLERAVDAFAQRIYEQANGDDLRDHWMSQLIWDESGSSSTSTGPDIEASSLIPPVVWPKWYWDLTKPRKGFPPGSVDLTARNRFAPLLLRLSWQDWPLFYSREHGWTFRVSPGNKFKTRQTKLNFHHEDDEVLRAQCDPERSWDGELIRDGFSFYKLPHKNGESANVGNPLAKTFITYSQDGILTSPDDTAGTALEMNAQCSYWISSRDRITNQMVVWEGKGLDLGFQTGQSTAPVDAQKKWGIIIPQVITMGTVTRRAIEKTWLTASNAKKNRIGSELKAMVRAPDGYAIVGADVDSEELWISSCMGDAQFGLHGATALGWMTLEGTKAAGTDLHSKTASILGISRDQAKVFNYSRIYGAGMKHAVLLLLQSNPTMLPDQAQKQAEKLYASTKGKNTYRQDIFGRKFWFGGSESYVFNKLEEIALSDHPQTPALGCGVTHALSKEYLTPGFGSDYMTSRINWVVQSSGVDYLHLLIVSMEYLIKEFDIKARYLVSVHDELRYLVRDEDKYRLALALQIANLWTRSLFAFKLGMDDLPQGVAFFSSVDVDKVLRKEVDLPCVTPSQPIPIPPGESLNIQQTLEKTYGGSLWSDGRPMSKNDVTSNENSELIGYEKPNCLAHRATSIHFLRAQATTEFEEVKMLGELAAGVRYDGGRGGPRTSRFGTKKFTLQKFTSRKGRPDVDWKAEAIAYGL